MKKALKLAAKGIFTTGSNPCVGCLIVKGDSIIAEAYHQRPGEQHAEVLALGQISQSEAQGATVYVTLEPCSHFGKNPPCADALIAAKVKTVVVCNDDPNPLVAGQGYAKLKHAGIQVITGVLHEKGRELNQGFLHRMESGLPWVRCKMAQSVDGRTAMDNGDSHWITGNKARADVQYWRGRSGAIITGIGTVQHDDCRLTVRPESLLKKHQNLPQDFANIQPIKVIVDSELKTPLDAAVLADVETVIIATASDNQAKMKQFAKLGVQVKQFPASGGEVNLQHLVAFLAQLGINEVLVEAGATLAGAMVEAQLIDEMIIYTAPVLMGSTGRPLFKLNIEEMSQRLHIEPISLKTIGKDWRLRALIKK